MKNLKWSKRLLLAKSWHIRPELFRAAVAHAMDLSNLPMPAWRAVQAMRRFETVGEFKDNNVRSEAVNYLIHVNVDCFEPSRLTHMKLDGNKLAEILPDCYLEDQPVTLKALCRDLKYPMPEGLSSAQEARIIGIAMEMIEKGKWLDVEGVIAPLLEGT